MDEEIDRAAIEALRDYRYAQRRMLEKWADGDDNVKQELWRTLHACEAKADAVLARHDALPSDEEG